MSARMAFIFSIEAWVRVQQSLVRQMRRWAWALVGALWGSLGVAWLASDLWQAHDHAQQALDAAQSQWQAQPQTVRQQDKVQTEAHAQRALWSRLPGRLPADIATALQQTLQRQGLTVVSLRVLSDAAVGSLHSQSLALRLNGPFANWVQAWQSFTAAGPVLSIDRMSVLPLAQSPGVQLDLVLRVWSNPALAGDGVLPAWPSSRTLAKSDGVDTGDGVFALAAKPDSGSPTSPVPSKNAPLLTDDPLTWPVERIRLLGTWQQDEAWGAVLSAGGGWVTVRQGQRISSEGHSVQAIRRDAVMLRTAQGQKIELNWAGGGR